MHTLLQVIHAPPAEPSLAKSVTVFLGMLAFFVVVLLAVLEKERTEPCREHAPECYDGDD